MAVNYASRNPHDEMGDIIQGLPTPFPSQTRYNTANAVASSVISLNPNTTRIEVGAVGGQGLVIRWIPLTETAAVSPFASVVSSGVGANFDNHIPAGWYREFVIPKETQGLGTAPMQVGSAFGLYQRVAVVNAGITASSVLLSEF